MGDTMEPEGGSHSSPIKGEPTGKDLDRILDVKVALTVELGRCRVRIADVLSLNPGSVVEFPKSSDEPLDIRINDQLVARGEAVVVGERYGVRVIEVVSPNERLKSSGVIKEITG
jgi:flagellar motor switch protein FliN